MVTSCSSKEILPTSLDRVSEWRAWQALAVYFTVLLNRQLRRRWELERKCMENRPMSHRFTRSYMPFIFLESVPTLYRPRLDPGSTGGKYNPYNTQALEALKTKTRILRARVEKCKELASEIECRLLDSRIQFPTDFCHTCVVDGDIADILLTKCAHRVCVTCLSFGMDDNGDYECSICFAPAQFVARSPLTPQRSSSEHLDCFAQVLPRGKNVSFMLAPVVKEH